MASSVFAVRRCSKITLLKDSIVMPLVTDAASLGPDVVRGRKTEEGACGGWEEEVVVEVVR